MSLKKNVINFAAGPAKLPTEVLAEVQNELLDYDSTGCSVMELSHRSQIFQKINENTIQSIKQLLEVPDNYKILLMQGGGTGLFAAVAINLIGRTGEADYFVTGLWSAYAAKEAEKYGKVNSVFPRLENGKAIPDRSEWKLSPNASYVYYCDNETIEGFEYPALPEIESEIPLVCDMSSNILTRKVQVEKFGLIFAGVQKNLGPAGITIVIVREDLIGHAMPNCAAILNFELVAKANSILNTPPTFVVYVLGKVLKWIKEKGGVQKMEELSAVKSKLLYDVIDSSNGFYISEVHRTYRSRVNVTFRIKGGQEVEDKFIKGAQELGMIQLKGHRSVGGIRASLYNAISVDETEFLKNYMEKFLTEHLPYY